MPVSVTVRTVFPLALSGLLISTPSFAAKRDLDSHEHGAATLGVIIDASELYLEFESPWDNLVGFEHEPSTDDQHAAVDSAMASFESVDSVIQLPASAECTQTSVDIDSGIGEEHGDDDHADEDHADEEHAAEEHGDEEHAEKEHGDEEHSETHSEIRVSYVLDCSDIGSLDSITVNLFDTFPDIDDLDVEMAGPGGQSAAELSAETRTLELDAIR